jgi:lysophospholipase L1-like esterase
VLHGPADSVLAVARPDVVVFTFLGNNLTACAGGLTGDNLLAQYAADLEELCRRVAPAPCVAVGQPALGPDVVRNLPAPDEPTALFRERAAHGEWGFVDLGAMVEHDDGSFDPVMRMPDGVHLNAVGADRFGSTLAAYLRALLG